MEKTAILAGDVFKVPHPFRRTRVTLYETDYDGSRSYETDTWAPGVYTQMIPPDDCEWVADAIGHQVLTVVSTHKPGPRYPTRVFYTRQWRDPDGKTFGKTKLRILSEPAFNRLRRGYRYEFRLNKSEAA